MADIVAAVPGFWVLAGLSAAAVLAEIAILVVSAMRLARLETAQRLASAGDLQALARLPLPSRGLEIIAALIPFALAAPFVRTIHGARGLIVSAMSGTDPSEKAMRASRAVSEELNTTPLGLLAVSFAAALGALAVGLAVGARLRSGGLRRAAAEAPGSPAAAAWLKHPGPNPGAIVMAILAFLVLGSGPIVQAGYAGILLKIKAFAATDAPPDTKGEMVSRSLDVASALLDRGFVLGRAGAGIAFLVAAFLAWRFSAARARTRMLGGKNGGLWDGSPAGLAIAGGAIALAVGALIAARPLRRENQMPWPPYEGGERFMGQITTADLDGPDPLERAPVITLTPPDVMTLDGFQCDGPTLADKLGTLAHTFSFLRPGEPFNGVVLVICQADTTVDRLAVALRAAVEGSSPQTTFGFLRRQETDRPLLGHRWRNVGSSARATTVRTRAEADPDAALIQLDRFPTCAAVSKQIVTARRAGRKVALLLPTLAVPKASP